jgi:hypothetical protein
MKWGFVEEEGLRSQTTQETTIMYIHQESITRLYPTNKQASKRLLYQELVTNKQASKQEIVPRACTQQASKQARNCTKSLYPTSKQASQRL